MAIYCIYDMKLVYENERVHNDLIKVHETRPDLYDKFIQVRTLLISMEHDDILKHIKEELAKKDRIKQVKEIPKRGTYEYRIPPHQRNGVLRMEFKLDDDFYTIIVTSFRVKPHGITLRR